MTIRRVPTDFAVFEHLAPALRASVQDASSPDAPVALYLLTKTSLTTPEGVERLAKSLGVRSGHAQPAGLKDKHATTSQHVSLLPLDERHAQRLPPSVSGPGWEAKQVGWIREHLSSSAIAFNHFDIIVRDLSPQASSEIDRRAARLRCADQLLIVNYFGDQRFGSARHGQGFVGARLIRGDFEAALKLAIATPARKDSGAKRAFTRVAAQRWPDFSGMLADLPRCPDRRAIEHLAATPGDFRGAFATLPMFLQQMCVEAFQSHLWNTCAREAALLMEQQSGAAPTLPTPAQPRVRAQSLLLRTPDEFGEMLFPVSSLVISPWLDCQIPLLAPGSTCAPPIEAIVQRVLEMEGIALADLRIPGLRRPFFGEAPRPLFMAASRFAISGAEQDELSKGGKRIKRTLSFDLPRGSYATVLLRALGQ